ncbi:MAG TPA: hypothetical protein VFW35_00845 [Sphingomicrobium sp.]|nr:hypothetical protein [Sphingomicrobium sp.]
MEAAVVLWLTYPWLAVDSSDYLRIASGDFALLGLRTPAYPLFLAIFQSFAVPVQLALYLVSVWLVSRLTDETMFVGLACIYIFPLFYTAQILSEGLTIFCIALVAWALWKGRYLLAGAMSGFAVLARPDQLVVIPALLLVIAYRREWRRALVFVLAAFVVLLPYMSWNAYEYGKLTPVPVQSTIGQSLYLASWEGEISLDSLRYLSSGPLTAEAERSGFAPEVRRINAEGGTSDEYMAAAFHRMTVGGVVSHAVRMVWRLFNTGTYPAPRIVNLALIAISAIVWALGMVGLGLFWRRPETAIFLAVLIPHLFLHTEARYTASIRLILMLFAVELVRQVLIPAWSRFRPVPAGGEERRSAG